MDGKVYNINQFIFGEIHGDGKMDLDVGGLGMCRHRKGGSADHGEWPGV